MRNPSVLLLAGLLIVVGCGPAPAPSVMSSPSDAASSVPSQSPTPSADPTLSPGLACGEIHLVPADRPDRCEQLDAFWGPLLGLSAVPGSDAYVPPDRVLPYRAGDVPDTACTIGALPEDMVDNAFYCPADERIVFDEGWFRRSEAAFGANAPVAVLAHEWGHHVQEILGVDAGSIQLELQADCLAGLFLASAIPLDAAGEPTIGDAELIAGLATFFDLGDDAYAGSRWFAPGVHGSPVQRMLAFSTGILGFGSGKLQISQGLPWCLGYRAFKAESVARIGPYRLVQLPGRPGSIQQESYVIPPDTSTAIGSSTIILRWIPDFAGGATQANIDLVLQAYGANTAVPAGANGAYLDLSGNVGIGTGIARYYVMSIALADGTTRDESGWMGLLAPASGDGALFVLVTRPEGPPIDMTDAAQYATLEEETLSLYQVINRLCTPDHSDDPGAENLSTVCMVDDQ